MPLPLTPGNFDVTYGDNDKHPFLAAVIENVVRITASPLPGFTPPNGISYHATPQEIFGDNGLPALPFVKFPFS